MKATMRVSDNTYHGANLRAAHHVGEQTREQTRADRRVSARACCRAHHCADPQAVATGGV